MGLPRQKHYDPLDLDHDHVQSIINHETKEHSVKDEYPLDFAGKINQLNSLQSNRDKIINGLNLDKMFFIITDGLFPTVELDKTTKKYRVVSSTEKLSKKSFNAYKFRDGSIKHESSLNIGSLQDNWKLLSSMGKMSMVLELSRSIASLHIAAALLFSLCKTVLRWTGLQLARIFSFPSKPVSEAISIESSENMMKLIANANAVQSRIRLHILGSRVHTALSKINHVIEQEMRVCCAMKIQNPEQYAKIAHDIANESHTSRYNLISNAELSTRLNIPIALVRSVANSDETSSLNDEYQQHRTISNHKMNNDFVRDDSIVSHIQTKKRFVMKRPIFKKKIIATK